MTSLAIPANSRVKSAEMLGRVLVIRWHDGHRSELPLGMLRDHCPCAACQGAKPGVLKVLGAVPAAEAQAIQPVGRYALQFFWGDGHATGIYSFDLLRQLCQCPDCVAG